MLIDALLAEEFSAKLLHIQAIQLQPEAPFQWASGWRSPIYCDNRLTLSYPDIRDFIQNALHQGMKEHFPDAEAVAGVATAGIAHGLLLAEAASLPFAYVRSSAKSHGRQNRMEGRLEKGQKVVVVEDLISTGGSALDAVRALQDTGVVVQGVMALYHYGFSQADAAFEKAGLPLLTITDYPTTIRQALDEGRIEPEQEALLRAWREDPESWGQ